MFQKPHLSSTVETKKQISKSALNLIINCLEFGVQTHARSHVSLVSLTLLILQDCTYLFQASAFWPDLTLNLGKYTNMSCDMNEEDDAVL